LAHALCHAMQSAQLITCTSLSHLINFASHQCCDSEASEKASVFLQQPKRFPYRESAGFHLWLLRFK